MELEKDPMYEKDKIKLLVIALLVSLILAAFLLWYNSDRKKMGNSNPTRERYRQKLQCERQYDLCLRRRR
jgi:hypothetical protein